MYGENLSLILKIILSMVSIKKCDDKNYSVFKTEKDVVIRFTKMSFFLQLFNSLKCAQIFPENFLESDCSFKKHILKKVSYKNDKLVFL